MREDPATRSRIMRRVKSADTKPELTVRRLVHGLGFRYRLHVKDLPGKPDLAFRRRKKVIFVHGCFWHGHDCVRGARTPKNNRDYWLAKIARNVSRDQAHQLAYAEMGWRVLILWECELKDEAALAERLQGFLANA
ncbi:very short patch repair endonuclease [Cerasicoccus frondis]|uniref:very short patch repair endonuclease n=1 Tax=Cerasicoccus frondis TaxID=490090 RepID=UPI002852BCC9|nr:DNA mismatch endonuclease Vsr [Cerasicoccus frondis]